MRTESVDYGYTIDQSGDGYVISYRQKLRLWQLALITLAGFVPWFFVCGFLLALLGKLLPEIPSVASGYMGLILIVLPAVLSLITANALLRLREARRRHPTISITRDYLEANGKRYERRHIRQIYAQAPNAVQNNQPAMADNSGTVALGASGILGGSGVAVAGLQAGADGIRNSVGLVSHGVLGSFNLWSRSRGWSIGMLYGAKPVRIASRLQPAHADLLAQDLVRLLTDH